MASVLEQAQASRRAEQLAEIQYREGSINFLVLLDAQRTMLQAEDELAQAETAANTGAVAVYKALGGAAESDSERSRDRPLGIRPTLRRRGAFQRRRNSVTAEDCMPRMASNSPVCWL